MAAPLLADEGCLRLERRQRGTSSPIAPSLPDRAVPGLDDDYDDEEVRAREEATVPELGGQDGREKPPRSRRISGTGPPALPPPPY